MNGPPLDNKLTSTVSELSERWQRARLAAICKFTGTRSEQEFFQSIAHVFLDDFELILKAIFLNSRNLGLGYQRAHKLSWERGDFANYLNQMVGSSCSQGKWTLKTKSIELRRAGCHDGQLYGARYCQYWREAVDGLVLGLSDDLSFARHASINLGDPDCADIIYEDEVRQTDGIWGTEQRWGPLPEEVRGDLNSIVDQFNDMNVDLTFLGLSEQTLYYKLESRENLTCGTAGSIYRNHLTRLIDETLPGVKIRDASPIAVYGERT